MAGAAGAGLPAADAPVSKATPGTSMTCVSEASRKRRGAGSAAAELQGSGSELAGGAGGESALQWPRLGLERAGGCSIY